MPPKNKWNPKKPIVVRETTNKLLEMIEEDLIDPKEVVMMCLKWMSEEEVTQMCKENDVFWIYEEEEQEDDLD